MIIVNVRRESDVVNHINKTDLKIEGVGGQKDPPMEVENLLVHTDDYGGVREWALLGFSNNVLRNLKVNVDKVSPSFYNAFYQMFDEGTFVDANYSVDVSKCIIICTTNYRTEEEAEKYLGMPIYSRFSKVVIFNPISVDDKLKIARKCYAGLMAQVDAEDKELIENNSVLSLFERVIKEGAYPNMRMLRNDIEDAINFEILKARGIIQ